MAAASSSRSNRADWDFYEPSDKLGSSTIPAAIGVIVLAAGVAFLYQRITMWMPLIYVNFLIAGGFAAGIGWLMAEAFLRTHGRSQRTAAGLAAGAALAAFVASFFAGAMFLRGELSDAVKGMRTQAALRGEALGDDAEIDATAEKLTVGDFIDFRVEAGWTMGRAGEGLSISGALVWVVWLLEAGILVGGAYVMAMRRMDRVYCESCGRFCDVREIAALRHMSPRSVHKALDAGSLDELLAVPSDDRRAPPVIVEAHVCAKSCPAWIDVSTLGAPSKKGGKPERIPLLENAGVPSAALARIVERSKQRQESEDGPVAPVRGRRPKPPDV